MHKHPAQSAFNTLQNITTKTCGSWLVSDSGVSANINVGSAAVIAGKPAPTGFSALQQWHIAPL
ncbi:hypothetical protein C2E19_01230 [Pseudomonas sp. DTU12.3]|nr:hypothetical protein C2E19_01230 [Pseudomonas sp. DTU12.3]